MIWGHRTRRSRGRWVGLRDGGNATAFAPGDQFHFLVALGDAACSRWFVQLHLSVIRYFEFKCDPPLAEHPADLRPEAKAVHGDGGERDEQTDLTALGANRL
jgi:hypothetical protein